MPNVQKYENMQKYEKMRNKPIKLFYIQFSDELQEKTLHIANLIWLELDGLWVAFKVQRAGLFHSDRVQFSKLLTIQFQQNSESRVQSRQYPGKEMDILISKIR